MTGPSAAPWPVGGAAEVQWIASGTAGVGLTVGTAIPAGFEAYATVATPDNESAMRASDAALIRTLQRHTAAQPWWLGYLDDDVVAQPLLEAREVSLDEDATPPGHVPS